MRFVSTNNSSPAVSLAEAVNHCVASDGGMFMPAVIPLLPKAYFRNIGEMSLREIAFVVADSFLNQDVDSSTLKAIVDDSFASDAPLIAMGEASYVLELFHGPTLTFKDYGARFMARLMRALDNSRSSRRNILVATTGNTGAAAANGLYKLDGVNVTVLYPRGQLTRSQTAQFTALGENIYPVEVSGTIEDCKRIVQQAIADNTMDDFRLTGANSINIARLLPQITFSLYAYSRLQQLEIHGADQAVYSMPTGNISNVVAATMAKRMGCPMGKIVAATSINNQVAPLLDGQDRTRTRPAASFAPSIDMTLPSGWPRLMHLYDNNIDAIKTDIVAPQGISNERIADTINSLRNRYGYTIDPHGAVAFAAAESIATEAPKVIFATGHPAKQLDIMTRITGASIEMPHQLARFMTTRRQPAIIPPTLPALKKHLHNINKK